jgi:hypothetical protein
MKNLWGLLVKGIYKRNFRAPTVNELSETIHQAWRFILKSQRIVWEFSTVYDT